MFSLRQLRSVLVLSTLIMLGGCSPAANKSSTPTKKNTPHAGHPDKGPHGGTIAEFESDGGDDLHAEIVIDRTEKKLTVYILDEDVKTPVAIDTEGMVVNLKLPEVKQITLQAEPQEKDKQGKSSRFVASDDLFGQPGNLKGTVVGTVGGKRHDGDFEITLKK